MPRNLKLTLAYDGSPFHGWQVQPARPTIQGALADAIERITGEKILPQGSGRTDAGVHALAQVASFQTTSSIPSGNLVKALNSMLPAAIRVFGIEEVAEDFHARRSAKAKTYEYRIYRGEILPPFLARYVTHNPFMISLRSRRWIRRRTCPQMAMGMFGRSTPPSGQGAARNSYIGYVGMVSSTTWCAIWWGLFCWWEKGRCTLSPFPRF
jgi:tRNA pseudouridine38-40 synthase